jgi:hypothetical protein
MSSEQTELYMALYERLWNNREDIDAWLRHGIENAEKCLHLDPRIVPVSSSKRSRASDFRFAALAAYMLDDFAQARSLGLQCVEAVREYLLGTWRAQEPTDDNTYDVLWWKRKIAWMDEFQTALMWGTALGAWEQLKVIAGYPDEECTFKEESRESLHYYLAICSQLKGSPKAEAKKYLALPLKGSDKRPRLLATAYSAILGKDAAATAKALNEYLKYYKQREFPRQYVTKKVARDGTVLYHLARREGIEPQVEAKYLDHIVRLPP